MGRLYLGIDPGLTGALATIDVDNEYALIDVWDMPAGRVAMNALLTDMRPDIRGAYIEIQQPMPKQGIASTAKAMCHYGELLGILTALAIPLKGVTPAAWKREAKLGSDKEASLLRARTMWPDRVDDFKLKKHHGRAEAALIAVTVCGNLSIAREVDG